MVGPFDAFFSFMLKLQQLLCWQRILKNEHQSFFVSSITICRFEANILWLNNFIMKFIVLMMK